MEQSFLCAEQSSGTNQVGTDSAMAPKRMRNEKPRL